MGLPEFQFPPGGSVVASLKQRGSVYYIQFYANGKQRRISTDTDSLQIAKDKLRQFESTQLRGDDNPLPTRTPIVEIVTAYVAHIRAAKTPKSAQTDIYYLVTYSVDLPGFGNHQPENDRKRKETPPENRTR